jgi:hypothetical protein
VAQEARDFQKGVEEAVRAAKRSGRDPGAAIDEAAAKADARIERVVDSARDRLAEIDTELRTQRNRLERIQMRAKEARDLVAEFAGEAKAKVQPSGP